MPTDNQVDKLIINQLTKQQYEAIENPSSTELYVTEDLDNVIVACTQAEYDALVSGGTVDANTLYVIISGS